jgi:biopolymer transport protein ExbB/TolQ
MPPDSQRITSYKAEVARVIRLEDALLEAMAQSEAIAPSEASRDAAVDHVGRLREALREAYAERDRWQVALFGPGLRP